MSYGKHGMFNTNAAGASFDVTRVHRQQKFKVTQCFSMLLFVYFSTDDLQTACKQIHVNPWFILGQLRRTITCYFNRYCSGHPKVHTKDDYRTKLLNNTKQFIKLSNECGSADALALIARPIHRVDRLASSVTHEDECCNPSGEPVTHCMLGIPNHQNAL